MYDTEQDVGLDDEDVVRRWLLEIKIASKEEKDFRKDGEDVWDIYTSKKQKKHAFNILWANTEILRPSIYNTLPSPDVRRRFKDQDPLGKAVSDVLNRSLEFSLEVYNCDSNIKSAVLDCLLPGRGVARVRYIPSIQKIQGQEQEQTEEALKGNYEELAWEQATVEHVQWDDFRHGPGKCWDEVQWVAFRAKLKRKELEEQFGDVGKQVSLTEAKDDDVSKLAEKDTLHGIFNTAEVWEIWDKEKKEVIFVSEGYKEAPLQIIDDPLGLDGFFPTPKPLYALENSRSLVPISLYSLYKEQAEELNSISSRINKLIDALKVRGIYDSTLTEVATLMSAAENTLVPAKNISALTERGGFENIIWFAPIEQLAEVVKVLYEQRDQCKAVIYELTGISDILRGATNPNETKGAQQIKAQWGTTRLQRLQSSVQIFIRDLVRMLAEIIAEKFQLETLMQMTMLPLPRQQDLDIQYQQQAQMAQASGQQPPPQQDQVTWEKVISVLKDDTQRTYKVDIETDSTIAATQQDDIQALTSLLTGIEQLVTGFGPAVQSGAVPMDVVKELILAVCRRAKMGNVVEDALDKIQPPQQQPDPKAQAQQQDLQLQREKMQQDMQLEQQKMQGQQAQEAARAQADQQAEVARMQHEAAIKQIEIQRDKEMEVARQDLEWKKAVLQANTSIVVAEIAAAKQAEDVSKAEQDANSAL